MTIMLRPDQERAIQEAIEAGLIDSVDQLIDTALQALTRKGRCWHVPVRKRCGACRSLERSTTSVLARPVTRKLLHEGHRL